MMKTAFRIAFVTLLAAAHAEAQGTTMASTTTGQVSLPSSGTLNLPQFNPSAGQHLVKVEILREHIVSQTRQVENLDPSAGCTATIQNDSILDFYLPALLGHVIMVLGGVADRPLGPYDGTTDYVGASGYDESFSNFVHMGTTTVVDPTVLSSVFVGMGTLAFPYELKKTHSFSGCNPVSYNYGNQSEFKLTITYTYGFGAAFCDASDGALSSCPCSNPGNPETGCDNAQSTGGAQAVVTALDTGMSTATITVSGFPPASSPAVELFRSTALESTPVVFGDGLRCAGTTNLVRLGATTASGGVSVHNISHGAGSGTFYYQAWYRNTPSTFCDAMAAFNMSNGQAIVW